MSFDFENLFTKEKIELNNAPGRGLDEENKYEPYKQKNNRDGKWWQGYINVREWHNKKYQLWYDVQLKEHDNNPHIDLYLKEYKDSTYYKIIQQINFYNNGIITDSFDKELWDDNVIDDFSKKIKEIAELLLKPSHLTTKLFTKESILPLSDRENELLLKKTKEELLEELQK